MYFFKTLQIKITHTGVVFREITLGNIHVRPVPIYIYIFGRSPRNLIAIITPGQDETVISILKFSLLPGLNTTLGVIHCTPKFSKLKFSCANCSYQITKQFNKSKSQVERTLKLKLSYRVPAPLCPM